MMKLDDLWSRSTTWWPRVSAADLALVLLAVACWLVVTLFMAALGFHWRVGDPWNFYWKPSGLLLRDPSLMFAVTHPDHVPGYIYLLAMLRGLLGLGLGLMQAVDCVAWIVNLFVVDAILRHLGVAPTIARLGALSYGLFPCTGLVYAVFPLADPLALLAATTGVLFYLQGRTWPMVVALALALLFHKFVWPVAGLIVLIGLWQKRMGLLHVLAILAPLVAYGVGVGSYFGDFSRLIAGNVSHGVTAKRSYMIMDGILSSLTSTRVTNVVQGAVVASIALLATALSCARVTRRTPVLLATVLPLALFALIANENLVWGVARFGKLTTIPLFAGLAGVTPPRLLIRVLQVLLILAFLTQLAFGFYVVRFYQHA